MTVHTGTATVGGNGTVVTDPASREALRAKILAKTVADLSDLRRPKCGNANFRAVPTRRYGQYICSHCHLETAVDGDTGETFNHTGDHPTSWGGSYSIVMPSRPSDRKPWVLRAKDTQPEDGGTLGIVHSATV